MQIKNFIKIEFNFMFAEKFYLLIFIYLKIKQNRIFSYSKIDSKKFYYN